MQNHLYYFHAYLFSSDSEVGNLTLHGISTIEKSRLRNTLKLLPNMKISIENWLGEEMSRTENIFAWLTR